MADLNPQDIENLTRALQDLTEVMSSMGSAMRKGAGGADALAGATVKAAAATNEETTARKKNTQATWEEAEQKRKIGYAFQDLGRSAKDFGSALLSTSEGTKKYAGSLKGATSAFGDLLSTVLPFGKTIKAVVGILSFAIDTVTDYNDSVMKAYNELGQIGLTAQLTTKEVSQLGLQAGYTYHNLENFTKAVRSAGPSLVGFGGTTTKGVKAFTELLHSVNQQRIYYTRLGLSQEQMTELTTDFVNKAASAGISLAKSPEKLRKESDAYVESIIKLQDLTGLDIKKQQEALDWAINQENLNARIYEDQARIAELDKQMQGDINETTRKRLQEEKERLEYETASRKAIGAMAADMGPTRGMAILEVAASKSADVITQSSASLKTLGIDVNAAIQAGVKAKDPALAALAIIQQNVEATQRVSKQFGSIMTDYGATSRDFQKTVATEVKDRKFAATYANIATKADMERRKKEAAQQEEDRRKKGEAEKTGDKLLDMTVQRIETEKKLRESQQGLAELISGPVNTAFMKLMETLEEVIDWVADTLHLNLGTKEDQERRKLRREFKAAEAAVEKKQEDIRRLDASLNASAKAAMGEGDLGGPRPGAKAATRAAAQRAKTAEELTEAIRVRDEASSRFEAVRRTGGGRAVPAGSAAAVGPNVRTSQEDLAKQYGLALRPTGGDIQAQDAGISPKLIALAKYAQTNIAGFGYFTAFNDKFHQENRPASKHTEGLAMDFSLADRPTPDQGKQIINLLRSQGASYVQDEYNNPSKGSTGGHIHVEVPQARFGGSFDGPISGYPAMLHGSEIVLPTESLKGVSKIELATLLQQASGGSATADTITSSNADIGLVAQIADLLSNKLDAVIDTMNSTNDIQQQILNYTRS